MAQLPDRRVAVDQRSIAAGGIAFATALKPLWASRHGRRMPFGRMAAVVRSFRESCSWLARISLAQAGRWFVRRHPVTGVCAE